MKNLVLIAGSFVLLIFSVDLIFARLENEDLSFDQEQNFPETRPSIEKSEEQLSIIQRVKRGFWNFFDSDPTTTTTTTTIGPEHERPRSEFTMYSTDEGHPSNSVDSEYLQRKTRDSGEDTVDTNGRRISSTYDNDDEDLGGSGEVEGSATDLPSVSHSTPTFDPEHDKKITYRITLTVGEPYRQQYDDRNSREFRELSSNLTQELEDLFQRRIPRYMYFPRVVKISPTSDPFECHVTIDIGSTFTDEDEVRAVLQNQVDSQNLGRIQLKPIDFTFRSFQVGEDEEANCHVSTELRCRNGACVPLSSRCDGINHCTDGTDEMGCQKPIVMEESGSTETRNESANKNESPSRRPAKPCRGDGIDLLRCDDGTHICFEQACDGVPDCPDGSDETGCTSSSACKTGEFACDVSRCILGSQKCDFIQDCQDGTDEQDCDHPACDPNQFRCKNGECVQREKYCDGVQDCRDHSDELNCPQCRLDEFKCASGTCVGNRARCNGRNDCGDNSDERNCNVTTCSADQFRCNDGTCLSIDKRCNDQFDCHNGEDEKQCDHGCRAGQLPCENNGSCIDEKFFCDGRIDCHDGSDEFGCPDRQSTEPTETHYKYCTSDEFSCNDRTCISRLAVCDGRPDCSGKEDEINCQKRCSENEFTCANRKCIGANQKCDGTIDCEDGSDESGDCPGHTTTETIETCPAGQFMCISDKTCLYFSSICNGIPECKDGSDEDGCGSTQPGIGLDLHTYPSEQVIKESREVVFQCRDEGPLRAQVRWIRGNNLFLPSGTRDIKGRLEIPNIQMDHGGIYICEAVAYPESTPGQRVTVNLTVEKFEQPVTRPPHVCKFDEATCSNGDCIPKSSVCNSKIDCTDGSDEMRCNPHGCQPNEFRCDNKQCVSKLWYCDGQKDCADGSDEEGCPATSPDSVCRSDEFPCKQRKQGPECIPKTYHCDGRTDCEDNSDEIGCSTVYIVKAPSPMMVLQPGESMILTCSAIGVPIPLINWRLNWGHIPKKCTSTSINGTGTLNCPDVQVQDQGAYSCEAFNQAGFVFAVPDTILIVKTPGNVCPRGKFNSEARTADQCISCFCFGVATECRSANLFTYQIPPPFDRHKFVSVETHPIVRVQGDVSDQFPLITPIGRDGFQLSHSSANELNGDYNVPYYALPESYHGSQLKSYGGYLKYQVRYRGNGSPNGLPSVILSGNDYVLVHKGESPQYDEETQRSVRFFYGDWYKYENRREVLATREEIMMTLANLNNILIKVKYDDTAEIDVRITNIVMDTARNTGLDPASFVEECQCPSGYTGFSCEHCAPGYIRRQSGPWLGQCYRDEPDCPPGYYGDPSRNIPCQICPCPLTNPANQFARTCHLGSDGQPTCDCPAGYVGRRCEQCEVGYQGNPLIAGGMCDRVQQCDLNGSLAPIADPHTGKCRCKQFVTGLTCDQCKPNTFDLATANQHGCINCFCMGVSSRCISSNLFRNEIRVSFTNSIQDFSLIEGKTEDAAAIVDGIQLDAISREIVYNNFPNRGNNDVYYWQLPSMFLGDQITSYGGNLKYTVRHIPSPGGQSSRNNAADVELISANDITLLYYSREWPEPDIPESFTVPLLEQHWQRADGTQADREHLMMALADVRAIRIKATYTTHTKEAALSSVSLDNADKYNTGRERAVEVEECTCPAGYKGLSCQDCDVGFTRAVDGLYLGTCEPCNCNRHSDHCDPETGICKNCNHQTTGDKCDVCIAGYDGDATRGTPYDCTPSTTANYDLCQCNESGSNSRSCMNNQCECKPNVMGGQCDRCRPGTFGLSADNAYGCNECYCSGLTDQCHESSLYVQLIPMGIFDSQHGFTLTDSKRQEIIDDGFVLNEAMNEVGYRYPDNSDRVLFWSLPPIFTGNKIKSYGGSLRITQHITARAQGESFKAQDILLVGNGITLFWTNPVDIQPDVSSTYEVSLRESEWKRSTLQGSSSTSRAEMMTVLSNLEAILVRASHNSRMTATYISEITLETAVDNLTGHRRATQIEACRCPIGYIGTSCETCAPGYYRNHSDRLISSLGTCNLCPCNNKEQSCEINRSGHIKCHCQPGYRGQYCQDPEPLMVSLMPMKGKAPPRSVVEFLCSYEYPEELVIDFNIKSYEGLPLTARGIELGPTIATRLGAQRNWKVRLETDSCNVECHVNDKNGTELARIVTSLKPISSDSMMEQSLAPVDYHPSTVTPLATISPPRILVSVQEPEFQIVHTGNTVRYHCTARPSDNYVEQGPLNISWNKEDGRLPHGRSVDDFSGLLIITDVKVSDSGIYVCQVSDGVNVAVKRVTLTVGDPEQPRATISPASLQVEEGEPVEFHCGSSGSPRPELDWQRVYGPMNPRATFYNGIWRIPAASVSDAAEYKCIARNSIGLDEKTTILYVRGNANKPTFVTKQPTITPSEWHGTIGEPVRLICASPEATNFTWTRFGGLPLLRSTVQSNGVLTILHPTLGDSGLYVCTITSYRGTETSKTAEISILPHRPRPVKALPERQTAPQGTTVEIRCSTNGESDLQVHWTKNSETLSPRAQQIDEILRIPNVQVSDRGIYICHVTGPNGMKRGEAAAIIEVERREAPVIELHPNQYQTMLVGTSAVFIGRVTAGFPMPKVQWRRQDGRSLGANIEQLGDGILRVSNITFNDAGIYVCSAYNEVGSTEETIQIEVQSIPVISIAPPMPNGILYVKSGDRVRLTCSASGHPQPNVSWRKYSYDSTSYHSTPRLSLTHTPLHAVYEIYPVSLDDEGSYTCQATNAAGTSEERISIRIEGDNSIEDVVPCRGDKICPPGTIDNPDDFDRNGGLTILGDFSRIPIGSKVEIRCKVHGLASQQIHLQWQRSDRRSLPPGSTVDNGILTIPKANKNDAGEYVCVGEDSSGTVLFSAKSHLEITAAPQIELNPTRQTVRPGENPSIICTASGDQPIGITWEAIGRALPNFVTNWNGTLQFNGITYSDAGKYVCKATNDVGTAEAVAEVLVNEHPYDDPYIRAMHKDINTHSGNSVKLQCQVREHEPLHMAIHWTREGKEIPRNSRQGEDYLELLQVGPEDSGRYICQTRTNHGISSDYINLNVSTALVPHPAPAVSIKASQDPVNIGDTVDIQCSLSTTSYPRYRWTGPNRSGGLPFGAQESGGILRLANVSVSDGGIYRCEVDTPEGRFEGDYNLVVHDTINDEPEIETRHAPYDSDVRMDCRSQLDPPIKYEWSKLGGPLPKHSHARESELNLTRVKAEDAGTYVCNARNDNTSIDIPTVLVVTRVLPHFNQAPESYILLPQIGHVHLKFTIEVSFNSEKYDGIILYSDESNIGKGDFIGLSLEGGYPQFRIDVGSGTSTIKSHKPISLGEWHTIKIQRNLRKVTMFVDGVDSYTREATGKQVRLDLNKGLYVGGVPNDHIINPEVRTDSGFVGCISRLIINDGPIDLIGDRTDRVGVTTCETCAENPCNNAGVCQEAATKNGYTCLCRAGYTGDHCDSVGQSCYPGLCGDGECANTETGFECNCPPGRGGSRCEYSNRVRQPGFRSERSFLAHRTPKALRRERQISTTHSQSRPTHHTRH